MIIYKITNKINGKIYVGQTMRSLVQRISEHKCHALSSKRSRGALQHAIVKYGFSNFEFESLYEAASLEDLNIKEVDFIKQFDCLTPNGYNLDGGGKNKIISEETKKKMSQIKKELLKDKTKHRNFGKKLSVETRQRIAKAHSGKYSEQLRQSNENKKIKVICLNNGKIYDSIRSAAIDIGTSPGNVSMVLVGKYKQINGFSFKYLNKDKEL